MTDRALSTVVQRRHPGAAPIVLQFTTVAALTAAADKWRWIVPFDGVIVDVLIDSETAGSGGTSDIADIHLNGTTIFTTQANRPTLLVGDTGAWTKAGKPEVVKVSAGDILTLDIDQICTTGSALSTVCILIAAVR